jgi:hypothetical protein
MCRRLRQTFTHSRLDARQEPIEYAVEFIRFVEMNPVSRAVDYGVRNAGDGMVKAEGRIVSRRDDRELRAGEPPQVIGEQGLYTGRVRHAFLCDSNKDPDRRYESRGVLCGLHDSSTWANDSSYFRGL